jgi:hypothetical protein
MLVKRMCVKSIGRSPKSRRSEMPSLVSDDIPVKKGSNGDSETFMKRSMAPEHADVIADREMESTALAMSSMSRCWTEFLKNDAGFSFMRRRRRSKVKLGQKRVLVHLEETEMMRYKKGSILSMREANSPHKRWKI